MNSKLTYWQLSARRLIRDAVIEGDGKYAVIATCEGRNKIWLHGSMQEAEERKSLLDGDSCGSSCHPGFHSILNLADLPDSFRPGSLGTIQRKLKKGKCCIRHCRSAPHYFVKCSHRLPTHPEIPNDLARWCPSVCHKHAIERDLFGWLGPVGEAELEFINPPKFDEPDPEGGEGWSSQEKVA